MEVIVAMSVAKGVLRVNNIVENFWKRNNNFQFLIYSES